MRKKLKLLARPLLLAALLLTIATAVTSCGHDEPNVPAGIYEARLIEENGYYVTAVLATRQSDFSDFVKTNTIEYYITFLKEELDPIEFEKDRIITFIFKSCKRIPDKAMFTNWSSSDFLCSIQLLR